MIIKKYKIKTGHKLNIALVTDLHESNPKAVLKIIRKIKPDIICVAGDTFERRPDVRWQPQDWIEVLLLWMDDFFDWIGKKKYVPEYSYCFLREACKMAPVFMSLGNHEWYLTEEDRQVISESGAVLLEDQDVEWNGIRIGALSSKVRKSERREVWLNEFSQSDGFKILLCHHPEYYLTELADKKIDLILAGHAHGGQIRLFGRGIFAPGQGLFPRYHHGLYDEKMVVSAGCSNTASFPRLGNPREVVIIQST